MSDTCRGCSTELVPTARYCHQCGRGCGMSAGVVTLGKILSALILASLCTGLGAAGACFAVIGMTERSAPQALLIGLVLLVGAFFCLTNVIRILRNG